jgi:hypothetical protein
LIIWRFVFENTLFDTNSKFRDANDLQAGVLQKMMGFGSLQQRILGFEFRRPSCVGGEEAAAVAAKDAK